MKPARVTKTVKGGESVAEPVFHTRRDANDPTVARHVAAQLQVLLPVLILTDEDRVG
jgi:hypothetical protein